MEEFMDSQGLNSSQSQSNDNPNSESDLVQLTYASKLLKIQEYLQNNPDVDIISMRSTNQYSLLHLACMNNQLEICKLFFGQLVNQNQPFKEIKKWTNSRTSYGHTAIHFASMHGNLTLITLLEDHGANIYLKDYNEFTVMHFAAQGDQALSLVYFNIRGLTIYDRDSKGKTPLHVAAMEGMENAVNYLISRGSIINAQDYELKYTALHYAVFSGNYRIVKKMLSRGADPSIKGQNGDTALDLAVRNNGYAIIKLLQNKSFLGKILGLQKGRPQGRSWSNFICFFLLYTIILVSQILFVLPFVENAFWITSFVTFSFMMLLFFLLSWGKDPGFLRNSGEELFALLKKYDAQDICPDCVIVKPARSKHCELCKACISVYDHHCTWTNNCVGARNHRYFLCMTLSTLVSLILLLALEITHYQDKEPLYIFVDSYIPIKTELLVQIKDIVCGACGFVAFMFIFPLMLLNYVQIGNFLAGKTTNERYGAQGRSKDSEIEVKEITEAKEYFAQPKRSKWIEYYDNCSDMCFENALNYKYIVQNPINRPTL